MEMLIFIEHIYCFIKKRHIYNIVTEKKIAGKSLKIQGKNVQYPHKTVNNMQYSLLFIC